MTRMMELGRKASSWKRAVGPAEPGAEAADASPRPPARLSQRSPLARYGVAVLLSALPILIKWLLDSQGLGRSAPFLLLIPAVLLSSWYGGLGPGLLATVLTGLGVDLFFLAPYGTISKGPEAIFALTVYGIEGALVTWMNVAFRRSRDERLHLAAEERVARIELEAANRLQTWLQASPMPIISLDPNGTITRWNPAAERLFGWNEEEMVGKPLRHALPPEWQTVDGLIDGAMRGESVLEEGACLPAQDGTCRDVHISTAPVRDAQGWPCGMMAVLTDVTERKQMEKKLHHQALHDDLTGLPNRKLFYERLQRGLQLTSQQRSTLALLLLDLDGFKEVNDTFGHHYGDLLLQDVCARLQAALPDVTVARLGGDEFAAILEDTDRDGAEQVAEKIVAALADPFPLAGQQLRIAASVGSAVYPMDGTDANMLLQHADVAMYAAKRARAGHTSYVQTRQRPAGPVPLTADRRRGERRSLLG